MKTRILLVDDHGVVRKGLRFLLESEPDLEVVGEAADGCQAVEMAAELDPDVIVMDIGMPRLNGIDATTQIVRAHPHTAVVILSVHSDETYLVRTLSAGAKGYLLKDSAEEDLVRAIRSVSAGKPFFSPAIAKTMLDDYVRMLQQSGVTDSYALLTDREKQVLQLLAQGKTNKDVAVLLDLSPYTVETHRTRIMQKLNLHNTAEIVLYAVRKKLVS
jgi:two-component system, NarL family, response regulator NreC